MSTSNSTGPVIAVAAALLLGGTALFAMQNTDEATPPVPGPEATAQGEQAAPKSAPRAAKKGGRAVPQQAKVDPTSYTTTASGLQLADIVVGSGEQPTEGMAVTVEYAGWLEDGTLFDTSYKGTSGFTFSLGKGQVIPGWDEGIATMKVGGKRQLRIPAALAYGPAGFGKIPPNANLVFDVELVKAVAPRKPPAAPVPVTEWTTTASGLQYHDHEEGAGAAPLKGKLVRVDYTGWLEDGTMFDSSYTRATPLAFRVGIGQVIKGWDEGLLTMKPGGKRQLKIPYQLAYGEGGMPPDIPPKATLIFDVHLVSVD